jgi:hypothetical protein
VAETQIEQLRKLVVKAGRLSARVSVPEQEGGSESTQKGQPLDVLKDADFDINIETRENENDKTGTVPKRKVCLFFFFLFVYLYFI